MLCFGSRNNHLRIVLLNEVNFVFCKSFTKDLFDNTAFTRADQHNEMSNILINVFKHNSTRLSTRYPHAVDNAF